MTKGIREKIVGCYYDRCAGEKLRLELVVPIKETLYYVRCRCFMSPEPREGKPWHGWELVIAADFYRENKDKEGW